MRDHYSEALDTMTYTQTTLSLGAHPRNGKAPFIGRQILCFLEKLRLSVHDLIKIGEFGLASKDDRERRRKEKSDKNRRREEEFTPNFWVVEDPDRHRHELPITFHNANRPRYHPRGIVSCVIEAKEPFTGPSSRTPDHAELSPTPHGQGAARWITAEYESRSPPDHVR